jgi:hypothetical protein
MTMMRKRHRRLEACWALQPRKMKLLLRQSARQARGKRRPSLSHPHQLAVVEVLRLLLLLRLRQNLSP